jgi:hypothetical protein
MTSRWNSPWAKREAIQRNASLTCAQPLADPACPQHGHRIMVGPQLHPRPRVAVEKRIVRLDLAGHNRLQELVQFAHHLPPIRQSTIVGILWHQGSPDTQAPSISGLTGSCPTRARSGGRSGIVTATRGQTDRPADLGRSA